MKNNDIDIAYEAEKTDSIPNGWKEYKLNSVINIIKESYNPCNKDELPYIGLEHIEQERLRLISIGKSSEVTSNKYKFIVNDILFGKLRPYFRKVVKPKFDGICSTDIWVIRAKKGFTQDYLYYFIANWDFVNTANNGEGGTRMPRADWSYLKETKWIFPPLPEQKAIAEVLSSLDDKIDLLHRQNKTLEELAETLFRQRFIEEAEEGWEEKVINDIISVKGGTTPSTKEATFWDGAIKWVTPRDLSNHTSVFLFDSERKITEKGLRQISSGLLPIGTVLLSSRAPIGYLAITDVPVAINQGFISIICDKKVSNYFIYLWCKLNMQDIHNAANGSVFQEISKSVFKQLPITVPPIVSLKEFVEVVEPIFSKIKSNAIQIRKLIQTRDTLLPKLMSGEARVKMIL